MYFGFAPPDLGIPDRHSKRTGEGCVFLTGAYPVKITVPYLYSIVLINMYRVFGGKKSFKNKLCTVFADSIKIFTVMNAKPEAIDLFAIYTYRLFFFCILPKMYSHCLVGRLRLKIGYFFLCHTYNDSFL